MLEDVLVFKDHMILGERQDALPQLSLYDFKTKKTQKLTQSDPVYDVMPEAIPSSTPGSSGTATNHR